MLECEISILVAFATKIVNNNIREVQSGVAKEWGGGTRQRALVPLDVRGALVWVNVGVLLSWQYYEAICINDYSNSCLVLVVTTY